MFNKFNNYEERVNGVNIHLLCNKLNNLSEKSFKNIISESKKNQIMSYAKLLAEEIKKISNHANKDTLIKEICEIAINRLNNDINTGNSRFFSERGLKEEYNLISASFFHGYSPWNDYREIFMNQIIPLLLK